MSTVFFIKRRKKSGCTDRPVILSAAKNPLPIEAHHEIPRCARDDTGGSLFQQRIQPTGRMLPSMRMRLPSSPLMVR